MNVKTTVISGGVHVVASDLTHNIFVDRDKIAVTEAEHRVEMHGGSALRHQAADHSRCSLVPKELARDLPDGLVGGAFAHSNKDDAFADGHDISTFHRRACKILVRVSPPNLELRRFESRMKFVDCALQ